MKPLFKRKYLGVGRVFPPMLSDSNLLNDMLMEKHKKKFPLATYRYNRKTKTWEQLISDYRGVVLSTWDGSFERLNKWVPGKPLAIYKNKKFIDTPEDDEITPKEVLYEDVIPVLIGAFLFLFSGVVLEKIFGNELSFGPVSFYVAVILYGFVVTAIVITIMGFVFNVILNNYFEKKEKEETEQNLLKWLEENV
jgi:hypothetical protein